MNSLIRIFVCEFVYAKATTFSVTHTHECFNKNIINYTLRWSSFIIFVRFNNKQVVVLHDV